MKTNLFPKLHALFLAMAVGFVFAAVPAFALDLKEAKAKGLLGEKPTGYLGVVKNEEGAEALAQEINAKRKEEYKRIAEATKASLESVETLAGQKAMSLTPAGQFIESGGSWQKK